MRNLRVFFGVLSFSLVVTALVFAQTGIKGTANRKPASAATGGDAGKGKEVYDTSCGVCHFHASTAKKIGPGLRGLYKRGNYAGGKPVNETSLKEWIEKGGKNMPAFKETLTGEQIRDLIAFLKTI